MSNTIFKSSTVPSVLLTLISALLLAACGGTGDSAAPSQSSAASQTASAEPVADSAKVDAAIEKTPCALVTPEMVATVFDVPVAELEQSQLMSSSCEYTREGDGESLQVSVDVDGVFEDAKSAASRFRSVTAGMSGAEVDRAMAGVREEADRKGDLDTAGKRGAADAIISGSSGSAGIQFEDVEGVGDEARLALTVGAGKLYVRSGNLNFTVAAYSGADMPMPDKITAAAIMNADKQWRSETMPQRKQAAVKLAKAVVASL